MNKLIIVISICVIAGFTACNSIVDGLNDNPNSPTSAAFQNILTGAEVGNIVLQTGESARRAGIFCGYYTGIQRQHQGFSTYTVTTSDFDALWQDGFINGLRNAKVAEEVALEEGLAGVSIGITQVLQALIYGTETSLFGAIPFEEAAEIFIENPQFESQLVVYNKIQTLLDQAIINLQTGSNRPASGSDIYFDGDPDAWIAVANTLKARYYMHTKQYNEAYIAAQEGINNEEGSMNAMHGSGLDENNLSYQFFAIQVRGADLITSDFMTSLIAPSADLSPNFSAYRGNEKTNEAGRYGFYFQINDVGTQPNTVDGLAAAEASAPIVTYQENLLILAESGLRSDGFSSGLAALNAFRAYMAGGGYMTNAESSDIQYDPYTADDFNNGGIENPDNISPDNALLREVLEERYVTFFGQIEGFCDVRRTLGESAVRVQVQPNDGDELPQRFIYPQSEIDRNDNIPNPIPGLFQKTEVNL